MTESLNIPEGQKKKIPKTAKGRMKQIMQLPLKQKLNFMPEAGLKFIIGPYVYQVALVSPGKLRFTAKLIDVIIQGVNDGSKSKIINPHTGKPAITHENKLDIKS